MNGNKKKECEDLVIFLRGFSAGLKVSGQTPTTTTPFEETADWMQFLSEEICCAGIICKGGHECTSDHK